MTGPEKARQDPEKLALGRLKERVWEKLLRYSQMSYRVLNRRYPSRNRDTSSSARIVTVNVTIA